MLDEVANPLAINRQKIRSVLSLVTNKAHTRASRVPSRCCLKGMIDTCLCVLSVF